MIDIDLFNVVVFHSCLLDYQRDPEGNQPKAAVQAATLEITNFLMTMGVLMVFLGMGAAKSVLGLGHTFDSRFQSCDAPQTKPSYSFIFLAIIYPSSTRWCPLYKLVYKPHEN